jgi:hypothetical protein
MKPLTRDQIDGDQHSHKAITAAVLGAHETARLAHDFRAAGHRSSVTGDGRGTGLPSDPTASAVMALNSADDGPDRWHDPDPCEHYEAMFTAAWRQYHDAARRMLAVHNQIRSRADHQTRQGSLSTVHQCVNRSCGCDVLPPDKPQAGRCPPCYAWRNNHEGTDAPKHVVDSRNRVRKHRAKADC